MRLASIVGLLFAAAALAQTPARPAFEAAAIHLHPNCREQRGDRGNLSSGRLDLRCASIRSLIRAAYGMFGANGQMLARPMNVIDGPGWLDSDQYDLDAKAERAASVGQTVGRMLKESAPDSCTPLDPSHPPTDPQGAPCGFPTMRGKNGNIVAEGRGMTIAQFAARMLTRVDRPVIDKTGLTGRYDIHLEYSMINAGPVTLNGGEGVMPLQADSDGASIFSAVQSQLGLRLSPDSAPIDVIIVDSVERPSEN